MTDDYTPTEYLILEVLAARYRLGETLWPFPNRFNKALRSLEAKDMIGFKSGIVAYTKQAWLTPKGISELLSAAYTPPIANKTREDQT